jgi:hypothetical protein
MLAFLVFRSLGPSPKGEREMERERRLWGAFEVDHMGLRNPILGFFWCADFRM